MKHRWHTAWENHEIAVYRDDVEVDRIDAEAIRRIVFVYRGSGDSPGDLQYALVETDADVLSFAADTGFAGRVNFERLPFWAVRNCVYWVPQAAAALPLRLRRGAGWFGLGAQAFRRIPKSDAEAAMAGWPLEGPQTWEQRKWQRIQRSRPFAALESPGRLRT